MRITELSCENVASRCASCGEAAMRRRGGGEDSVCAVPRVGEDWSGESCAVRGLVGGVEVD